MILPRFDVLVPDTVDEACVMLAENIDKRARIIAGGTDILVDLRRPIISQHVPRCDGCPTHPNGQVLTTIECDSAGRLMPDEGSLRQKLKGPREEAPEVLISIHKLKNLKKIEKNADGSLKIGALTTITEIERSDIVRDGWMALAEGADSLGSPLVRNRGTLGGNIANARPAADTFIPTVTLNGQLTLNSLSGSRTVAAEDFATGPGQSVMKPDEILTEINYPAPLPYSASAYYKLANRKALEISTVGVGVWLALEEPGGPVKDARVALGAVGPKPILANSVKDVMIGQQPDNELFIKAAKAAAGDARPIDDHRGSAWYRVQMVEQLTYRLLKIALERIGDDL